MNDSTDEILKRIQERIDGKAAAAVATESVAHQSVKKLNPAQITSEVFVITPTQIDYIAETFGNLVADGLNMRTFAPKIRIFAQKALRDALRSAKRQGKK